MKAFLYISLLILACPFVVAEPAAPCTAAPYRQFDFWQGDWIVKDATGNVVGENSIRSVLGGCALSENWRSARGNEGKSYNFYDISRKRWHQTWVDDSGGSLYLDGEASDGKMVLEGTAIGQQGEVTHRITWTLLGDGKVKQHWQVTTDGGKNWNDAFLGFYERVDKKTDEEFR